MTDRPDERPITIGSMVTRWRRPGTTTAQQYNHYSLLRSIEDVFGLAHLGYAAAAGLRPFGADVYTG